MSRLCWEIKPAWLTRRHQSVGLALSYNVVHGLVKQSTAKQQKTIPQWQESRKSRWGVLGLSLPFLFASIFFVLPTAWMMVGQVSKSTVRFLWWSCWMPLWRLALGLLQVGFGRATQLLLEFESSACLYTGHSSSFSCGCKMTQEFRHLSRFLRDLPWDWPKYPWRVPSLLEKPKERKLVVVFTMFRRTWNRQTQLLDLVAHAFFVCSFCL